LVIKVRLLVKKKGHFENEKQKYQNHLEKSQNKLPKTRWARSILHLLLVSDILIA